MKQLHPIVWLFAFGLFCLCLSNCTRARGAPSPTLRQAHPQAQPPAVVRAEHVQGNWLLNWHGGRWHSSFFPGGMYQAFDPQGRLWLGTWAVDEKGVLRVTEKQQGGKGHTFSWSYQLVPGKDFRTRLNTSEPKITLSR